MEISLNRISQERIFTFLILVNVLVGIMGIYTLHASPTLSFNLEFPFHISESKIQKIDHIKLSPAFLKRLPEFFTSKEETNWWRTQEGVYSLLREKDYVEVEFIGKNIVPTQVEAMVGRMSFLEVFKRIGLIYLVALIYIISAVAVFQRHRSTSGSVLAFFLLSGSLYLISSAPVVSRSITIHPLYFKILIKSLYISAGGLITLVHFAFLFPIQKEILRRFPVISYIFYGYFLLMVTLYLSGIIAFGSTFPFLCLWTLVMIGVFIHSLIKERDPFLRKQITLSILAPLMVGSVFILFYLLPGVLGITSMRFTYLALFSLILPFALPSAMDNIRLYQERLEMEQNSQREKEQIKQDLHDNILNDLANISLFSEVSLNLLDRDITSVREKLKSIKDLARDSSRQLRGFLWVTDEGYNTWEDLCGHLRRYGYALLKHLDIDFDFDLSDTIKKLKLPSLLVRACLYQVFREVMTNVIKHSHADTVKASLSSRSDTIILEIKDNGSGFNKEEIREGHYGLKNMKRRVDGLGGTFTIETRPAQGTHVKIYLPLG